MATYTSIPAFTSGQVLTSSVMNDVKNNLDLSNAQSAYPYRSLLYNGAMQISQRGTSTASITTSGYYTADRWATSLSSFGTWTQSVENDAPTGSGLRRSLKMLCTTADASPAAGDYGIISQRFEGFDMQRIAKGTSSAQSLTLSFWVKSNVTGTFIASLEDSDNTRFVSKSYTVTASGTWEKKELSFPADTTGALDNDANTSLTLHMWLGAGSSYTSGTLQTTWAANGFTNVNNVVGQTNVAAATNNYWQITGVQLEVGSVSTPFEFLPYGDELARCQRYYYKMTTNGAYGVFAIGRNDTTTAADFVIYFPVPMRTAPGNPNSAGTMSVELQNTTGLTTSSASPTHAHLRATVAAGLTAGAVSRLLANNNVATTVEWGAEL